MISSNRAVVDEQGKTLQSTDYYPYGMPYLKEFGNKLKPKSVIRISLCRTAKRNPLIFPI